MSNAERTTRRSIAETIAGCAPDLALGQGHAETEAVRVQFAFGTHVFAATLSDNPTARDLWQMLPLDLTIEDYSTNEKIAYLPRKLTTKGSESFGNEALGDLCYYAPWGNLVFYYARYRYSGGLIRLGRLDAAIEPLMTRGRFLLRAQQA